MKKSFIMFFLFAFVSLSCTNGTGIEEGHLDINGTSLFFKTMGSGDADPMPVKYAEMIHRSIDGSELVIAEGAGHWLFVDATDTFTSSVFDFLAEVEQ